MEKPGKHHLCDMISDVIISDVIKVNTNVEKINITCFSIYSNTETIISLIFPPRLHNLHLIMRKHQIKPKLELGPQNNWPYLSKDVKVKKD